MRQAITFIADGTTTKWQLPVSLTGTSDVISSTINGSGVAVSAVAGDLVTLASAGTAGQAVVITYRDRRADTQNEFTETKDRPLLTSYTAATHTLVGEAIPGNIVDVYAGTTWVAAVLAAADGTFSLVLPTFAGTQLITAVQRRPDPWHATTAVLDGYGISSVW